MKQRRRKHPIILNSTDPPIDNARQLRCWRCDRRMLDYNEAVYEFLTLVARESALLKSISSDGRVEIVRTRCPYCNAYNSLDLHVQAARPPRARDHPNLMAGAH